MRSCRRSPRPNLRSRRRSRCATAWSRPIRKSCGCRSRPMLDEVLFFDTLREGLWVSVIISFPILAVALVAGLLVGLFQALTSIQELTLTFVPKLGAIIVVFWLTMGFMTQTLVTFFQDRLVPLITGG